MLDDLRARLEDATARRQPLRIAGHGSKTAYLPASRHEKLEVGSYTGIIDYAPHERVISARAGTSLGEIDTLLRRQRQMLACEPPTFDGRASLGGALAAGWSGPRRPWAGALRDQVLGVSVVNGKGELLRFGGRVIKNVAGFDCSRLMVGSQGTLGIIVEAHLRVQPLPEKELVVALPCSQSEAIRRANQLSAAPLPLAGAAWEHEILRIRLAGTVAAVRAAQGQIGGDEDSDGADWFDALRQMRHPMFDAPPPSMALWRLSLPQSVPPVLVGYPQLVDWAGGQRWLIAPLEAARVIHAAARSAGGHAACWRSSGDWPARVGQSAAVIAIERRLKAAFDPGSILNDGMPIVL